MSNTTDNGDVLITGEVLDSNGMSIDPLYDIPEQWQVDLADGLARAIMGPPFDAEAWRKAIDANRQSEPYQTTAGGYVGVFMLIILPILLVGTLIYFKITQHISIWDLFVSALFGR